MDEAGKGETLGILEQQLKPVERLKCCAKVEGREHG